MAADYGSRALTARDYSRALTERLPAHERMRTPHNMLDLCDATVSDRSLVIMASYEREPPLNVFRQESPYCRTGAITCPAPTRGIWAYAVLAHPAGRSRPRQMRTVLEVVLEDFRSQSRTHGTGFDRAHDLAPAHYFRRC